VSDIIDTLIIGGGPSGLSAAMWLGRYQRSVIIYDGGEPRNKPAWAVHGYPGLADPSPLELRRRLLEQALGVGAERRSGNVVRVEGKKGEFSATAEDGDVVIAKRIVLAYGLRDYIPSIQGLPELYGTSVFHCADCDGPSVAGSRIGVIGWNRYGARLALYLSHWTESVTMLSNACPLELNDKTRAALTGENIEIVEPAIACVNGHGGNLVQVEFTDREPLRMDALFFHLGSEPRCDLAEQLQCGLDEDGYLEVDRGQETTTPGVHATGDITGPPHLASIAAAEGVRAALAIHRSLLPDSFHL
jgi:thioredoxin reductase